MPNHYQILGIPNNSSQADIKAAYRKLAMIHHPDRGGDPEMFKAVNTANSVLSDPTAREAYDFSLKVDAPSTMRSFYDFFKHEMQEETRPKVVAVDVQLKDIVDGCSLIINANGMKLNITIPKMTPNGDILILPGMGAKVYGPQFTDLHVVVKWKLPPNTQIDGANVIQSIEVDYLTLMLGGTIPVVAYDNSVIDVVVPPMTSAGNLRIKKHGLNRDGFPGDLYLRIAAVLPSHTDPRLDKIKGLDFGAK